MYLYYNHQYTMITYNSSYNLLLTLPTPHNNYHKGLHQGPRMSFTSKRSRHQPKGRASLIFVLVAVLQVSISHLVWWDPEKSRWIPSSSSWFFWGIFQGKLQMPRRVATTYLLHAKSRHVWSFHHHVLYLPLDHVTKGHHCCSQWPNP